MSTLLVTEIAWVHALPILIALFVLFRMWYLRKLVSCPNSIFAGVVLAFFYIFIQASFVYSDVYLYWVEHGIRYADMSSILFSLWEAVMLLSYERSVSFCVTTGHCRSIIHQHQGRCADDVAYSDQRGSEDGGDYREDHILGYDEKEGCVTSRKITSTNTPLP